LKLPWIDYEVEGGRRKGLNVTKIVQKLQFSECVSEIAWA
jgi:hypothetical protein